MVLHIRRPGTRTSAAAEFIRDAFWVLALGLIGCYAFFVALGAFSPADVLGVTIAVAILVVLWGMHAWARRRHSAGRDSRLVHQRERRGF
jgi:membrane protein implicated in regulation of membrane protease activity